MEIHHLCWGGKNELLPILVFMIKHAWFFVSQLWQMRSNELGLHPW